MRIRDVFRELEKQADFAFFFSDQYPELDKLVTLDFQDEDIEVILERILEDSNLDYEILNENFIVITPREVISDEQRLVTGAVTDAFTMEPLIGANVIIEGTTFGVVTDVSGNFSIALSEDNQVLVISYVGYLAQRIGVSDIQALEVSLVPDVQKLEEVVVIGYGTQKKRDLSGAVSVVDIDEMQKVKVAGIGEALQGQAAGISVHTSGSPGGMAQVRIRGIGSFSNVGPLYVIDGLILNDPNNLNTSDIESIQILKDASAAALYGARGANGVIIITTKRGKEGPAKVEFSASIGLDELAKKIDMMNSIDYLYYNQLSYINGGSQWFGAPAIGDTIADTDWQNAIFETGRVHNYNLSISGGEQNSSYMLGAGYFSQDGVLQGPWYNRYSFRVNSEGRRGRFSVGENISFLHTDRKSENGGSFSNALSMPPVIPVYDPDEISGRGGYGYGSVKYPTYSTNPVAAQESIEDIQAGNRLIGNLYAELEIIKGLKLKTNLGADYWNGRRKRTDEAATMRYLSVETRWFDRLYFESQERLSLIMEHTLTYQLELGKHSVNALAGYTAQKTDFLHLANEGYNQLVEGLWQIDLVSEMYNMWGNEQHNSMISYLGRVDYNYDNKYLFQFNIRRDGSSKFGPSKRWGTFPSSSLAWRISNEGFFEPLKNIVSDLKFRISYGKLGDMQALGNYDYQATINHSGPYEGFYAVLGEDQTVREGALQSNRVNPNLGWETKTTLNVGSDFGILNNKLYGTIEWFDSKSTDLLVTLPLAMATGVGVDQYLGDANEWTNYGEMENIGIEFSLGWKDQVGKLNYNVFANITSINNKVLKLGESEGYREGSYNQVNRTEEGRSIADFYLIETNGIFQSMDEVFEHTAIVLNNENGRYETRLIQPNAKPGDIRFVDFNEDGQIDLLDRQWLGSPFPDFEFGLNISADYQGFDLTMFWFGVYGNEIFNGLRLGIESMDSPNNIPGYFDPWTWDNPSGTNPRPYFGTTDNARAQSDRWLEDGSFLRLKNLQLGYSLPEKVLTKLLFIDRMRIYLSGQNLLTFTKYKGYDPEFTSGVFVQGVDTGDYPPVRSYLMGIQLSF
ncbi:MAG: TonB-dependent receptor [Bacteroidales bacterium]|nr:TonB-dependent receptor [Bacteroidales bacterium]